MQKKLIALAVATAFSGAAFAQSNVTISGKIAGGFEQYKLSDTGAASYSSENRVSDAASRIIFNGSENLGGGLSAVFQVDNRFSVDTGTRLNAAPGGPTDGTWGSGNTYFGLKSDSMGLFGIGRVDLHYNEFAKIESTRAGGYQTNHMAGILSQVNGTNVSNPMRSNNAMWWDSPNWNGVTARLALSTMATTEGSGLNNGSKNHAWNAALRYDNGPITAGLSYWNNKTEGGVDSTTTTTASSVVVNASGVACPTGTTTSIINGGFNACQTAPSTSTVATYDAASTRLWAGYTFPFGLKVGLGYDNSKRTSRAAASGADQKRTAWTLPISYTTGNHGVYLTYSKANDTSGVTASGARLYTLGYDYALSKRTAVGAYYTNLRNDVGAAYQPFGLSVTGGTAPTAGMDMSQVYLGVSHSF